MTPYAPPIQDMDGNPVPEQPQRQPRNNIPTPLRPAIEALGAQVTHGTHVGTQVQIPGARVKAGFAPGGRIWTSNPFYPDHWILNTHMRGWEPEAIIHHIADGSQDHFGTHHHLNVSQTYETDGTNHWMEPHASLMTYPNGRPHSRTWPKHFRDFQNFYDQHHPPETKGFARDVMLGHAPIEALADWLAEQHGVADLIRPHGGDSRQPGPDDYYAPPPTEEG